MKTINTTPARRVLSAGVVIAALAMTAACGSDDASSSSAATPDQEQEQLSVDQELHSQLPERIQEAGVIKVGTEAQYPPFDYLDEDNKTVLGIDPDLGEALGQVLGVDYEFINASWTSLLPSLDSGRYDLLHTGITDTKEREAKYDFVDYFAAGNSIVVKAGNPEGVEGVEDLCGLTVAVLDASTQQSMLGDFNEDECASDPITILPLPSDKDALLQVQSGRAEASFTQNAVASYNAKNIGNGTQFEVANDEPLFPLPVGIVFRKDDAELRDAIAGALEVVIESGVYEDVLAKHDVSDGAVDSVVINGAVS